jgi:hypothetical protein
MRSHAANFNQEAKKRTTEYTEPTEIELFRVFRVFRGFILLRRHDGEQRLGGQGHLLGKEDFPSAVR